MVRVEAVSGGLPAGLDALRAAARAEGHGMVERLAREWADGTQRFDGAGEALVAGRVDGALAGVGGVTLEPALAGALRMRRFYVSPGHRRRGVGATMARALLEPALAGRGGVFTVNAGTALAPAFWEALGFVAAPGDGFTHVLEAG